MPTSARTEWCRRATWATLALVVLTGCAVFRTEKTPAPAAQEPAPAQAAQEAAPAPATPAQAPPSAPIQAPAPSAEDPRVPELERTVAALRGELAELRSELEATRRVAAHQMEVADLRSQLGAMRRSGGVAPEPTGARAEREVLEKRLAGIETRLDALAGAVRAVEVSLNTLAARAPRGETASPAKASVQGPERPPKEPKPKPVATPSSLPPKALYDRGLESLRGGDFGQAVLTLEELVQRHPSHALAVSAQFWIGEAYFRSRDYRHAAAEYQKVVTLTQRGEKTPEALYKMGLAYRALKRPDRAREAWSQLVREFPQSPSAERARTALRELPRAARPASTDSRQAEPPDREAQVRS